MSNRIAFTLAFLIAGFFALDHFVLHLNAGHIAMRGVIDAIAWLAVWR